MLLAGIHLSPKRVGWVKAIRMNSDGDGDGLVVPIKPPLQVTEQFEGGWLTDNKRPVVPLLLKNSPPLINSTLVPVTSSPVNTRYLTLLVHQIWCWYLIYMIPDFWYLRFDTWYLIPDLLSLIPDIRFMIPDVWYLVPNSWYQTPHNGNGQNHTNCLHQYTMSNSKTIGRQSIVKMKTNRIFPKLFPSNVDRQAFANWALSALNNVFWVIKAGWLVFVDNCLEKLSGNRPIIF